MNGDSIWFNDTTVLYNNKVITEFWPNKYQSYNQRTNALSRLIIILGVVLSVYRQSYDAMFVSVIMLFVIYTLWKLKKDNNINNMNSNINMKHYNPLGSKKTNQRCQNSNRNNPFANVLIGDNVNRRPACPSSELSLEGAFDNKLYKNDYDVFNRQQSQRQYYTTSNTSIPNDQSGFANWLYGNQDVCKSNQVNCIGY